MGRVIELPDRNRRAAYLRVVYSADEPRSCSRLDSDPSSLIARWKVVDARCTIPSSQALVRQLLERQEEADRSRVRRIWNRLRGR